MPLPGSAAVTDASRTTAPLASFTMTCNSEVCTCAIAPTNRHTTATNMHDNLRATVMESSSSVGELLESVAYEVHREIRAYQKFLARPRDRGRKSWAQIAWIMPKKLTPTGVRFL